MKVKLFLQYSTNKWTFCGEPQANENSNYGSDLTDKWVQSRAQEDHVRDLYYQ